MYTLYQDDDKVFTNGASAERRGGDEPCLIPRSNKIINPETNIEKEQAHKPKWVRETPWTAKWILQWIKYDLDAAIHVLEQWVHRKRLVEASKESAEKLATCDPEEAIRVLDEFREPPKFIRGRKGSQMDVPMVLTTLDTNDSFVIKALLDTGCTGSSIDESFVRENNIATKSLHTPIPVYNADGSRNSGGPITECVELRVKIQDHVETLTFAVTNLGKTPVFIGYDWLEIHNPSIDWQKRSLQFDRCPITCNYSARLLDIEEDEPELDDPEAHLEEGDRIFVLDWQGYLGTDKAEIRAKSNTAMDLAIEENAKKQAKTFEEIVPESYHEYQDVFSKKEFDVLPERRPWDHAIELVPDAQPVSCKAYSLTLDEQKALDDFLAEQLRSGRIRPSKSPWASPFFFVKKKDGALRPVQDYRKLNDVTIKNRYPLSLIQDLVDKLKGAKYFTKLDVRWGYNNIRIKDGDEEKAAFLTPKGLFEPLVMFFGLCNSPATFQTMMNDIFRDLINEGHVVVYIDDIMIFTKTLEEHQKITKKVLNVMRKHRLYLKAEKCEFEKLEIEFLGMIISEGSVRMDPVKVEGVRKWPKPTCKRDIQAFLGFTNFYCRFVKDYGRIAKPLTSLTGNAEFT